MPFLPSILTSGRSRRAALLLLVTLSACVTRYGFTGGGLPDNIHTVAILPFENETPSPDLQRELQEAMRRDLQPRLGVREAPESRADAVVRGVIRSYDVDIAASVSAAQQQQPVTSRRNLQITLDVQIVDQTNGKTIFERKSLRAVGEYAEGDEAAGRRDAIKKIVTDLVEGAQSQW